MTTTKVELDRNDFELIFKSICAYDMYKDLLDKDENDSFGYLYSLCKEHLDCH